MENEITASEILGTVQRCAKDLKAFEQLHKVVGFLAQQEEYKSKLTAAVKNLEFEHDELSEKISKQEILLSQLTEKADVAKKSISQAIEEAKQAEESIISGAEKEAEQIVEKAKHSIVEQVDQAHRLKSQNKALESEVASKKAELQSLTDQYDREKKRLIERLQSS